MHLRPLLGTMFALLLCTGGISRTQTPSSPAFRAGVDMVVLQVTVTEPGRGYVRNLHQEDFTVFEDGRPQPVSFFSSTRAPLALSLLLDTSTSMQPMLGLAQDAASAFARRLGPEDVAQVIAFNSRVHMLQPFTNRMADLETAVRRTTASGSTALHTAVYVALHELRMMQAGRRSEIRRHAIVLLSDGEDTSSVVGFDQVIELARRLNVAIYSIALRLSPEDRSSGRFDQGTFVLRELAKVTGGRVFFAARAQDLAGVYDQVAEELSNQYTLAYVPANTQRDGRWRTIAVHVRRPACVASTRPGYFAAQ